MSEYFSGKVVVVTGGSRGIGRAIAQAFASQGAKTVLAATSPQNLETAAKSIRQSGGHEPLTVAGDLRDLKACEQLAARVRERFSRCDILVNSAGATRRGEFFDLADDIWLDGFALKFFACARLSRLFWPLLKEAGGHVVNIVGEAGGGPDILIGSSVNAAMAAFSKGLSQLGMRDGVNVNVIHPGVIDTDRFRRAAEAAGISSDEALSRLITKTGVRRIGRPDEVAELALFLCSKPAEYIQGTAITIDGGAGH
jgi:NAD(P)-dependent dehydrogenase (short-subunit alcohol dehydrogenase family)